MLGPSRRVESFGLWIVSRIQLATIHTTWLGYLNNLGMLAPYASLNLHFAIRQANIGYPSSWWAENQRGGHSRSKWYFAESERWQDWAYKGLVLATQAIANVVKSSFGPSGLDKMMVDDIGVRYPAETHWLSSLNTSQDVTVTNDGATILSLLDIEHPAGKILVDLAQQQDKEVRR